MTIKIFPTHIYQQALAMQKLNSELLDESYRLHEHDVAGQKWSKKNYPSGYTSYSSMSELFRVSSTFMKLKKEIDRHVLRFAKTLDLDVKSHKLEMSNLWININSHTAYHGLHLHPLSTLSGTYYLQVPKDSGDIKFEDPRMTCFMGSIPRMSNAHRDNQRYISLKTKAGDLLLFESWLRHEVTQNQSDAERVSLSFNYNWF